MKRHTQVYKGMGNNRHPRRRNQLAEEWMRVPGMTQSKLAKMFGLKSQSAVSKRLRRWREETGTRYARSLGPKTVIRPISLSLTQS